MHNSPFENRIHTHKFIVHVLLCNNDCAMLVAFMFETFGCVVSGCPCGVESTEKVLNCEIDFQYFGKVLNLAKMYIKY